ncbi:MAG: HlyD family type I secretion periplasmic adaptor subunit [Hyphomicrobiales bacterium]
MLASGNTAGHRMAIWGKARQDVSQTKHHRTILYMFLFTVVAFLIWAGNAPLDEVTRGRGKVEPLSRAQIIQSPEGGIVKSIEVQEGQEVAEGQILAIMDDTRFLAGFNDIQSQTIALRAALSRLEAEMNNKDTIDFDADVLTSGDVVDIETRLFEARRRKLRESKEMLRERLTLGQKQLDLIQPMVERGAVSAVEGIDLERKVADLQGQLANVENTYYQEVSQEIAKDSAELASLNEQMTQKKSALSHTVLKSPVRGIVKKLDVTTRGGVVHPGQEIMQIVPLDDQLYVEAKIRPRDVAFLHEGQPTKVKITAYDYMIYGSLSGKLVFISADTIEDKNNPRQQPYYRVRVLTDSASLNGPDGPLKIKPGMVAEVDITTGSKTVLDYLLKPILRGREALGER